MICISAARPCLIKLACWNTLRNTPSIIRRTATARGHRPYSGNEARSGAFDEPTSALDPERVSEVLQVIEKLAEGDHHAGCNPRDEVRVHHFRPGGVYGAGAYRN